MASKKPAKRSAPSRAKRPAKPTRPAPKKKAPPSHAKPAAKPVAKPAPGKPKALAKGSKKAAPEAAEEALAAPVAPRLGDGRRHVLSLSFLRDGDEFLARLESDSGQITELKNRSLDQLLTLVASELEDLLE
ncbi:MAG: hypothetical protein L3K23_01075 [Thermoplasmata archaeon]|nr:hypothetical protein [Thermoplasmata archaeon]